MPYVSRFTVSPPAISNFSWGFCCVVCVFWVLFVLFVLFPRLRDQPSSFTQLNDRLSCHGAHGMGEKATSAQGFTSLWWGACAHADWAI